MRGSNRTITVNRTELIAGLAERKAAHEVEYADAMLGWNTAVGKEMRRCAAACDAFLGTEDFADVDFSATRVRMPQRPEDYSNEYAKAIRMFEHEVDSTVDLEGEEISWYIHDEWSWSTTFKAINSAYTLGT